MVIREEVAEEDIWAQGGRSNKRFGRSNEDEMDWSCGMQGKKRNTCQILVGKLAGKGALERPKDRWQDNIKTNIN